MLISGGGFSRCKAALKIVSKSVEDVTVDGTLDIVLVEGDRLE